MAADVWWEKTKFVLLTILSVHNGAVAVSAVLIQSSRQPSPPLTLILVS